MIQGRVVGTLWATKGLPELVGQRLVLVASAHDPGPHTELVVAVDPVGAKTGDDVLVSFGSGARTAVGRMPRDPERPVEAAVTAILDPASAPNLQDFPADP